METMKTAFVIFVLLAVLQLCPARRGRKHELGRGHRGAYRSQKRRGQSARYADEDGSLGQRRGQSARYADEDGTPGWRESSYWKDLFDSGRRSRGNGARGRPSWRDRPWSRRNGRWDDWRKWLPKAPAGQKRYRFGLDSWFDLAFSFGEDSGSDTWWTGNNVCFTRSEDKANDTATTEISPHMSFHSQVCDGGDTAFKCTTTKMTPEGKFIVTETYECCAGYTRVAGEYGCEQEIQLFDIPELLANLELTEMINLINNSGMSMDVFRGEDNKLTIFAPRNDAFKQLPDLVMQLTSGIQLQDMAGFVMVSEQITEAVVDSTQNILLGHVVVGQLTSPQLEDNQILETASPLKTHIRINTYQRPVKLVTANCRPVVSLDNVASNGVVHVIDEVLAPVNETLLDIVSRNPEFSTLKTALGSSSLGSALRKDGPYTLFAPTDTAFRKHKELMAKLLTNPKCLDNVLKNHVFSNVICSAVIQGGTQATNELGKRISLTRDGNNKLYADGAQIVAADTMATNGVLYVIDDVLLPDEALDILENAEKQGLSEFVELINKAGLKKELSNVEDVTIFIPSNEAILDLQAATMDKTDLQQILKYHVVPDVTSRASFYNNYRMDTASGDQLRINEYSSFPYGRGWIQTVQCGQYVGVDSKACNGVYHVVDKVLLPPSGDVMDVVAQDPQLSVFSELLKLSGVADTLQQQGPFTVFAPNNKAFEDWGSDAVDELKADKVMLESVVKNHIAYDAICCAGVSRSRWFNKQRVRMLSSEIFAINKDRRQKITISASDVIQCDVTATNGVVHVVDDVLLTDRGHKWDWVWHWEGK